MKTFRRDCFGAKLLAMTLLIMACGKQALTPSTLTPQISFVTQERIAFETSDQVTIVGDWSGPQSAEKAVLLLHMMPATRVSWLPLSRALNEAGFATLAIDLRGHGESTDQNGKKLNYQNFSDAEHQASRLDIDAALNFLKNKGFHENMISVVGASIGANLTLDSMQRYSGILKGVLLSPGLDYRGVRTEPALHGLAPDQKIWIVAAKGDSYSAESTEALGKARPDLAKITIYEGSEHGTNLFTPQPELIPKVLEFLKG